MEESKQATPVVPANDLCRALVPGEAEPGKKFMTNTLITIEAPEAN